MASFAEPKHPTIRALLIDISGTLLIGSSPTPGAVQALAKLRAARIPFRLCSNTSKESTNAVYERMRAAGLDVRRAEVWTSVGALRAVLKEMKVKSPYMLLSRSVLEECVDDSEAQGDAGTSTSSLPHDAVVVGLAPDLLDYVHLNAAFRILIGEDRPRDVAGATSSNSNAGTCTEARPRVPLIALHKARYIEASDHALSLGPGPFVLALEDAARTSAKVVGKPTRAFFEAVVEDLERDLDPRQKKDGMAATSSGLSDDREPSASFPLRRWAGIAVIGDDVHADLGEGAIELGLWRVLVKTGKYRSGDEDCPDGLPPNQLSVSFSEFVETLLGP